MKKAFTLIELLVSIAIFTTIAVVLYSCFRGGIVSWRRVDSQQVFQQSIRSTLSRVAKDFKNMRYISNIPFEGNSEEVSFVTLLSANNSADINMAKVTYSLELDNEDGSAMLIKSEESLKDALALEEESPEENAKEEKKKAKILLEDISELKFSYLAAFKSQDSEEIEYEWLEGWESEDGLPVAIKIELKLFGPGSDKPVTLSKRIWIPCGEPLEQETSEE